MQGDYAEALARQIGEDRRSAAARLTAVVEERDKLKDFVKELAAQEPEWIGSSSNMRQEIIRRARELI